MLPAAMHACMLLRVGCTAMCGYFACMDTTCSASKRREQSFSQIKLVYCTVPTSLSPSHSCEGKASCWYELGSQCHQSPKYPPPPYEAAIFGLLFWLSHVNLNDDTLEPKSAIETSTTATNVGNMSGVSMEPIVHVSLTPETPLGVQDNRFSIDSIASFH